MSVIQIIAISLIVYLGSIGSIVGNTIGWYTLGRPLVASFVVGVIMGDLQTAMIVGIALQIMYMGNVTPGGAVAWDLSYATYIGTAGALVFGKGMESTQVIGLACRFIPAVILLTTMTAASAQADFASMIPGWLTTLLSTFGGMMAALGMGIIISFLLKKQWQICIFLLGFVLVTYFNLNTMAVAVIATLLAVIYYVFQIGQKEARA